MGTTVQYHEMAPGVEYMVSCPFCGCDLNDGRAHYDMWVKFGKAFAKSHHISSMGCPVCRDCFDRALIPRSWEELQASKM